MFACLYDLLILLTLSTAPFAISIGFYQKSTGMSVEYKIATRSLFLNKFKKDSKRLRVKVDRPL